MTETKPGTTGSESPGAIERDAGAVLMVGVAGPRLAPEERRAIEDLGPAGAIVFRRNLAVPRTLIDLLGQLADAVAPPPLLAIDQEGGRVNRLEPWVGPLPTAAEIARSGPGASFRLGRATGRTLAALGFNLDYAPVVDLCAPDAPNGIGDRSFGVDPGLVVACAGAFLDGLQGVGVAGCLKHFPGLGDTAVDSHVELPVVERPRTRLEAEDLEPYRALASRAASVMVGHAHYPTLDVAAGEPATLSADVVTGLLRRRLAYEGVVIGDDLEMGAVAPLDGRGTVAARAIAAGCDMVMYCSRLDAARAARDRLVATATVDPSFRARLAEAAGRVRRLAAAWPRRPAPADVPDAVRELAALAESIRNAPPR